MCRYAHVRSHVSLGKDCQNCLSNCSRGLYIILFFPPLPKLNKYNLLQAFVGVALPPSFVGVLGIKFLHFLLSCFKLALSIPFVTLTNALLKVFRPLVEAPLTGHFYNVLCIGILQCFSIIFCKVPHGKRKYFVPPKIFL